MTKGNARLQTGEQILEAQVVPPHLLQFQSVRRKKVPPHVCLWLIFDIFWPSMNLAKQINSANLVNFFFYTLLFLDRIIQHPSNIPDYAMLRTTAPATQVAWGGYATAMLLCKAICSVPVSIKFKWRYHNLYLYTPEIDSSIRDHEGKLKVLWICDNKRLLQKLITYCQKSSPSI